MSEVVQQEKKKGDLSAKVDNRITNEENVDKSEKPPEVEPAAGCSTAPYPIGYNDGEKERKRNDDNDQSEDFTIGEIAPILASLDGGEREYFYFQTRPYAYLSNASPNRSLRLNLARHRYDVVLRRNLKLVVKFQKKIAFVEAVIVNTVPGQTSAVKTEAYTLPQGGYGNSMIHHAFAVEAPIGWTATYYERDEESHPVIRVSPYSDRQLDKEISLDIKFLKSSTEHGKRNAWELRVYIYAVDGSLEQEWIPIQVLTTLRLRGSANYSYSSHGENFQFHEQSYAPENHRPGLLTNERSQGCGWTHGFGPSESTASARVPAGVIGEERRTNEELLVQLTSSAAFYPERATPYSAGLDLRSPDDLIVPPKGQITVNTQVRVAIPEGYYGQIASRSSLVLRSRVSVGAGVIDADYIGPLIIILKNDASSPFAVKKGAKIAQLILIKICAPRLKSVNNLPSTFRGVGGFGSTGS